MSKPYEDMTWEELWLEHDHWERVMTQCRPDGAMHKTASRHRDRCTHFINRLKAQQK